jgi:NAD(P)-dependent dehydrogenase (short-subunit alcohol dehydrogenase family)
VIRVGQVTFDFSDRVAVVTGEVSTGIGAAFMAAGAQVVTCGERQSQADGSLFVTANVRQPDEARRVIDTAFERFGRLDVLVTYAGHGPLDVDGLVETTDSIMARLLLAPFLCAQAAHAVMAGQEGGGVIVNATSVRQLDPSAVAAAYGAAQAGQVNLSATLAAEWGPAVRVNSIDPGSHPGPALARACLFLCCTESMSITGSHLIVPGEASAA